MNDSLSGGDALELVHPLYLDVPMMISFLAALEGQGVAFEGEELARSSSAGSQERAVGGRVGLPAIGALFGIDLTGRLQNTSEDEESRETKVLRRHTEASLFNLLRHRLIGEGRVQTPSRPDGLSVGELVEVQGNYLGNALQEIVDLFMKLVPYMGIEEEPDGGQKGKKNQKKSGNPAVRAQANSPEAQEDDMPPSEILRMMKIVREDLTSSAVEDAVVDASDGLRVVLTMSKEFLSPETRAQMLAARLRVLGKVSRVLGPDETINLTRRTAIGVAGPEVARELVEATADVGSELGDPVVEPPGIQIQPLAVFL